MSKFKKSMLIFGALILCVAVALVTFLALGAFDLISADPIAVEFTVVDNEKVYDGKPLSADWHYLTKGELLKGHRVSVEYYGSITNVGEGEGDMRVRILDEDDKDVSSKYSIKVNKGKLTVTPATLRVRLKDIDTVYTGSEIECNEFEVLEGTPGAGHTLALNVGSSLCNSGDRLELEDDALHVYDAAGADVTKNYNLEYEAGNVTISPRPITLRPIGETKVYDGIAVETARYEIVAGSLAPEQTVNVTVLVDGVAGNAVADAGDYKLTIDGNALTISDRDGKNVTSNYDVSLQEASLNIQKRPLKLKANAAGKIYDGRGVKASYTVEEGTLAAGHKLSVKLSATNNATDANVTEIVDKGTYTVSFVQEGEGKTDILAGETSVLHNYELTFDSCEVIVDPRPITLKPKEFTKTYDGIAANVSECVPSNGTSYAPGHKANITIKAQKDGAEDVNADNIKDAGSYTITVEDSEIVTDDDAHSDVTGNYAISVVQGIVTIAPRTLFVTGESRVFTYNSAEHNFMEPAAAGETAPSTAPVSCSGLPTGHTVTLNYDTTVKVTNVKDRATNKFSVTVTRDGTPCTDSFDVVYTFGTLTVKKGEVELKLKMTLTAQYTAAEISLADVTTDYIEGATLGGAVWDETGNLELVCTNGIVKNAGEYLLSVRWKPDADKTMAENVTLTVRQYGKLTVTPCELTLAYGEGKPGIVYGDTAVPPPENFVLSTESDFINLDALGVYLAAIGCSKLELMNIAGYSYFFTTQNIVLRDGSGFDVTDNYTFGATNPTVEIPVKKRKIALGFSPITGTNAMLVTTAANPETLSSLLVVQSGSLAGGDVVTINADRQGVLDFANNVLIFDIYVPGTDPLQKTYTITDAAGNDVTEFYDINSYVFEDSFGDVHQHCITGSISTIPSGGGTGA